MVKLIITQTYDNPYLFFVFIWGVEGRLEHDNWSSSDTPLTFLCNEDLQCPDCSCLIFDDLPFKQPEGV